MDNIISKEYNDEIWSLCRTYGIKGYSINKDGSIDVAGDVDLYSRNLDKLPLRFGKVSGNFICSHNKLTTLEGCPSVVGEIFDCEHNLLTSLEHSPTKVGMDYDCKYNLLNSLLGCATEVLGSISIEYYGLPKVFTNAFQNLSHDDKAIFLKYQEYFVVWTPTLNIDGMNDLIAEIKDGLL